MPLSPEAINPTSGRPVTRPILTQSWTDLTYLHWPYEPATVRPFLPPGVEPDVSDGATWVGLIPFAMRRVAVLGARLPYVSDFLETNVRLYGVDAAGRRSVVFLSLDADRLLAVAGARAAYRLPYVWSSMGLRRHDDQVTYTTRRRISGVRSLLRVRVGDAVEAEPLDHFLTARWALHSSFYGGTAYAPIDHQPWPLRRAELLELDDGLIAASGLPAPEGPPRVLHSTGVDVRIGRPVRMDQAH
jgi:uncharacterized protein YqjF (DUF2071 family)